MNHSALSTQHSALAHASAPGKLILCGEHAVVYNRPAIALPLRDLRATVRIDPLDGDDIVFDAPDLGRQWLRQDTPHDPLSLLVGETLAALGASPIEALRITISSRIPVASGMGSGAAVGTALVRALALYLGKTLDDAQVSALVYENERRLHGTPSGIDNTVVAFERPIWFVREQGQGRKTKDESQQAAFSSFVPRPSSIIEPIAIAAPFTLLIGDTGVRSATRLPVGAVRRGWEAEPERYEARFDAVGDIALAARAALAAGDVRGLGELLDRNHALLQELGVSSSELDRLVVAAKGAGALGAKLSGAGWGGVMLALVTPEHEAAVRTALHRAGAARVMRTSVAPYHVHAT